MNLWFNSDLTTHLTRSASNFMRMKMSLNQLESPMTDSADSMDFMDFKRFFVKEMKRLKASGAPTNCFVMHDYVYPDKPDKKLPIIVFGKPTSTWKQFMLGKFGVKRTQRDCAIGSCRFVEDGEGRYNLEFTIKKGKAKPRILKKKINKYLMPGLKGFGIADASTSSTLNPSTSTNSSNDTTTESFDVDDFMDQLISESLSKQNTSKPPEPSLNSYKKLEKAYKKMVIYVATSPESASIKILEILESIAGWYKKYDRLSPKMRDKHRRERELIEDIERQFEKLLDRVQASNEIIEQLFMDEESDEEVVVEYGDEEDEIIDNTDTYNEADDEDAGGELDVLTDGEAREMGQDFAQTKRELLLNAKELKALKGKNEKDLSYVERRQLKLLEAQQETLMGQRQKITDSLYEHWKYENGWADKTPREILRMYGDNWFKLKEELGYLKKGKEDSAVYEMKLAALEKLLQYRQKIVDSLLAETKKVVYQQIIDRTKSKTFKAKDVVAFALGSTTPTSDYDVTFEIRDYPQYEYLCVKYFNETFLRRFGVNSGMLFDTNVYTAGFMPVTNPETGKLEYKDTFNPFGKSSELPLSERKVLTDAKRRKHQQELALSLASVVQYLKTNKAIRALRIETISSVKTHLSSLKVPSEITWEGKKWNSADIERELLDVAIKDIGQVFLLAQRYADEVAGTVEHILGRAPEQENNAPEHQEAQIKDALYVRTLEKVSVLLEQIQETKEAIIVAKKEGQEVPHLFDKRAKLILEFKEEQGKALMYANEAYFSGGAALHVVKGMQGGGSLKLSRQQKMQSMLMNIGYQLQHFDEQEEHHGLGRAIIGTSKYGQRVSNLSQRTSLEEQQIHKSISGIRRLSSLPDGTLNLEGDDGFDLNEFMEFQNDIVTNYKKGDLEYPTPTSKDEAAVQVLRERFKGKPDNVIKSSILQTFSRSASRIMGAYYAGKYEENMKRRAQGETDISPVSFW